MKKLVILFITLSTILISCNFNSAKAEEYKYQEIRDFSVIDNKVNITFKMYWAGIGDIVNTIKFSEYYTYGGIKYYPTQFKYWAIINNAQTWVIFSDKPVTYVDQDENDGKGSEFYKFKVSGRYLVFQYSGCLDNNCKLNSSAAIKYNNDENFSSTFGTYLNAAIRYNQNKLITQDNGQYPNSEYIGSNHDIYYKGFYYTDWYNKVMSSATWIEKKITTKFEGYQLDKSNIVRGSQWNIGLGTNCDTDGYCSMTDSEYEKTYKNLILKYQFEEKEVLEIPLDNQYINLTYTFKKNGSLFVWLEDKEGNYVVGQSITEDKIGKVYNEIDDTYSDLVPSIDYTTEKTDIGGYKVTVTIKNLDLETHYVKSYNLTTGEEKTLTSGQELVIIDKTKPLDYTSYFYLAYDTILTISVYNKKDDYKILEVVIDINDVLIDLNNDPYVKIHSYNIDGANSVSYSYQNTKDSMTCYYKFNNKEEIKEECESIYIKKADSNTYLSLLIKEDNNVIYKKVVNLNFLNNYPTIKLKSWYDSNNSVQKVDISIKNTNTNTDTYYYSYDNENWTQFNDTYLQLEFYANMDLYVKVKRNDKDVSYGYIYVIYNSWENGNPTGTGQITGTNANNLLKYFDSLSDINTNITDMINSVWKSIKSNKISLFILINILGTAIILIFSGINRS